VLANGEVIQTGSRSVKQSSGYDLTRLFVGSEGTLGVVTSATLKLAPLPEHFSAVVAAFPRVEAAAQVVFEIIGSGLGPAALELLDTSTVAMLNAEDGLGLVESPHLLMEFHGVSSQSLRETLNLAQEICQAHACQHYQDGVGREERDRLWKVRHALFETALRHYPGLDYLLSDVAVPISQYPPLINHLTQQMAKLAVEGMVLGHAGDGNIHTIFFFPPEDTETRARVEQVHDDLVAQALALGGTSTGEHGVGLGKQKYMLREHGPAALNLMRQLKATLDPKGILNPGKVLAM
jgi:D-lactate dehydrogenase (cytochrome)